MKLNELMTIAKSVNLQDVMERKQWRKNNRAWFDALAAIVASREADSVLQVNISHSNNDGDVYYIFVGLPILGIVAQFSADFDGESVWYECASRGNFGKNVASGGNWSTIYHDGKKTLNHAPAIVWAAIEQQANKNK